MKIRNPLSLTIEGLAVMVVMSVLQYLEIGFEQSNIVQFVYNVGLVAGAVMTWYGRYRQGDMNVWGRKVTPTVHANGV